MFGPQIKAATGRSIPSWLSPIWPDHQYATYDDGKEQYIARGGPGPGLRLDAELTPARQSKDYGRGGRTLYHGLIENLPARLAVVAIKEKMDAIKRQAKPYLGVVSNSNWAVAEGLEEQTGKRIGDAGTPGYRPAPPRPLPPMLDK